MELGRGLGESVSTKVEQNVAPDEDWVPYGQVVQLDEPIRLEYVLDGQFEQEERAAEYFPTGHATKL